MTKPVSVKNVMVTAKMAVPWLATTEKNRKIRARKVAQYARDMVAGAWTASGDAVCFDLGGHLTNAHHRLLALIEADKEVPGISIPMCVMRGMPLDSAQNIDTGMSRSFGDALSREGEVDGQGLAAIVRFVHTWRVLDGNYNSHPGINFSHRELQEVFDESPETFRAARQEARLWRTIPLTPSIIGGMFIILSEVDEEYAQTFFTSFWSGADLPGGSPLLLLRESLQKAKEQRLGGRTGWTPEHCVALLIKVWTAYRQDKQIGSLKWHAATERFPRLEV